MAMATVLSRHFAIALTAITLVSAAHGQAPVSGTVSEDQFTAPVVWTQYKIPQLNVSIAMPKLPLVQDVSVPCSLIDGEKYTAYAEQAVYEFAWHTRSDKPFPKGLDPCEPFGKKQYDSWIDYLRKKPGPLVETDVKIMGSQAKMFREETKTTVITRWALWDIDRWFEMVVTRRKSDAASEEKFPYSLTLADKDAKEIGRGSERLLGDRTAPDTRFIDAGSVQPSEEVVIVSKPRPGYTEAARTKAIQGTITLQVPFLRNGSLGPITVVKGLPEGITEQGVAAAQRMSFLPARVNGVPVTVSKQIEYTFSIY